MSEIDVIIQRYLQGNTSEEENQHLHEWIQQSPENKKRLFAEKDIWDSFSCQSNSKNYETDVESELLEKRLALQKPEPTIRLKQVFQMAAILLVTFGLGWASRFISFSGNHQNPDVSMQEIFVPKGQVNQVFLADGTRIWINSESKLTVPSVFAANERNVKLSGEAFFEVVKDKNRPFKVNVSGQQIEVLGTTFNIRAYDNSDKVETTLETGSIRLQTGEQVTLLKPGEQSLFIKTSNQLTISKVNPVTFSSWKDGRYEFQDEDVSEVFKVVERWYDVQITSDTNYFKGMHFSGVIKRNKDARHFLELLNLTVPIDYEIKADKIKISPKHR